VRVSPFARFLVNEHPADLGLPAVKTASNCFVWLSETLDRRRADFGRKRTADARSGRKWISIEIEFVTPVCLPPVNIFGQSATSQSLIFFEFVCFSGESTPVQVGKNKEKSPNFIANETLYQLN
jgi:hypothetical protein